MTTQTAVLQQINIIRVCDANADWSQAVGYEKGENIVAHEGVAQTIAKVIAKLAAQHGPVVLSDQIRPELGRAVARIDRMWCGEDASMCTQLHQHHRQAPSWCRSGQSLQTSWPIASRAHSLALRSTGRRAMRLWLSRASTRGTQRFLSRSEGNTRTESQKEFVMTKTMGQTVYDIFGPNIGHSAASQIAALGAYALTDEYMEELKREAESDAEMALSVY